MGLRANHNRDFSLNNGDLCMDRILHPGRQPISNRYIMGWKSFGLLYVSASIVSWEFASVMSARSMHMRVRQVTAKGDRPGPGTVCNSGEPRAERSVVDCSRRTQLSSQAAATRASFDYERSGSRFFKHAMGIYSPFRREGSAIERTRTCAVVPRKLGEDHGRSTIR